MRFVSYMYLLERDPLWFCGFHEQGLRLGLSPLVAPCGEKPINQRNRQRTDRQRPQRSIRSEQSELDVPGSARGEKRKQDSSHARIRCRPRIRDHEEREEQEGAVLKTMGRDRQWLAEPERSTEYQGHVERDERIGHIAAARTVHDESAETGHQKREEGDVPPLSGRNPHPSRQRHEPDDRDVGRIEKMFAVHPENELARHGNNRRSKRQFNVIRSEEQAEGETRDQWAARIE